MKKIGIPAVGLFILWLLLSGHYTVLIMSFGAVSAVGVCVLANRFGVLAPDAAALWFVFRAVLYLPWLVKEAVVSAFAVARVIWNPQLPIRPQLIRATASQRTPLGLATFANSITLTPGTLSMDADYAGEILVHALTDQAAESLQTGEMDRRVEALEGRAIAGGAP